MVTSECEDLSKGELTYTDRWRVNRQRMQVAFTVRRELVGFAVSMAGRDW